MQLSELFSLGPSLELPELSVATVSSKNKCFVFVLFVFMLSHELLMDLFFDRESKSNEFLKHPRAFDKIDAS